ncbi:MAG: glutathionylspermidine synthase family protein [Polyangiaceae bacterium]|nr:glutathionylspermidine synthase family protein [Polyangiaceae bacterium]
MAYDDFARRLVTNGLVTDPWLGGEPRFREEPVILSRATMHGMYRAAEAVAEIYNELCLLVADEPALLDSFFCLSPFQKAMWLASQPLWHGIARADVFVTDNDLKFAELNCDTPTGEAEAVVLGELHSSSNPDAIDPNRDLPARFADMAESLVEMVTTRAVQRRAGIVYPTEIPEDLSLVRLYRKTFEARGWEIAVGSPYNLCHDERGLTLFGDPISLMLRHYKTDWWGERTSAWDDEELADKEPLEQAMRAVLSAMLDGSCAIVNPFGSVVPQNKRAMAFMWEQMDRFSCDAQEVIHRHVPITRRLEAFDREQLEREKAEWVLKSDYGAEGDEVIVGRAVTDEMWRASLAHARKGRWIAQRYFKAHEGPHGESVNHGVFLVAGEACGLYARVQAGPTDDHALSAAVLIEE